MVVTSRKGVRTYNSSCVKTMRRFSGISEICVIRWRDTARMFIKIQDRGFLLYLQVIYSGSLFIFCCDNSKTNSGCKKVIANTLHRLVCALYVNMHVTAECSVLSFCGGFLVFLIVCDCPCVARVCLCSCCGFECSPVGADFIRLIASCSIYTPPWGSACCLITILSLHA